MGLTILLVVLELIMFLIAVVSLFQLTPYLSCTLAYMEAPKKKLISSAPSLSYTYYQFLHMMSSLPIQCFDTQFWCLSIRDAASSFWPCASFMDKPGLLPFLNSVLEGVIPASFKDETYEIEAMTGGPIVNDNVDVTPLFFASH